MRPFESVAAVHEWFMGVKRPVSVLIDFTSIGVGHQRRTIGRDRGLWVLGFPGIRMRVFGGNRA